MGRGDFESIHSLQAVDRWIQVINSNLNASNRVGYKSTQVKFRGGVTDIVRNPQGALQGLQLPETTLQIDQTSMDFSQGSIINSEELTHLAIQGDAWFGLSTTAGGTVQYYTRDGEFHFDATSQLVNSSGLFLVASSGAQVTGGAAGNLTDFVNGTGAFASGTNRVFRTVTPQFLKFSQFGSTIFERNQATFATTGTDTSRVIGQALESSNASLSQAIPELSLAQKFFTAVSKIISVHQTNLDTVINLIR